MAAGHAEEVRPVGVKNKRYSSKSLPSMTGIAREADEVGGSGEAVGGFEDHDEGEMEEEDESVVTYETNDSLEATSF